MPPQQAAAGLAGLLRQLRTDAGMTQEELADRSGLSTRTVSDLERAVNLTARRDTAALLADALGLAGDDREHFIQVARGKPAAGAPVPAGAASASNTVWIESAASEAFVGREAELSALQAAWSHASVGHRVLTLVGGEPGIGKTALVAELARRVHAEGSLVLYGRWDEFVPAPYRAFREALTDYARACPEPVLRRDLAGLAGEVTRLYPVPAQRAGIASSPAPPVAPEAERFRLFESFEEWTGRMADRHPVLLVLDDLQWADQSSLLLLGHLMRARRSSPLLAVAMYRDTGPEPGDLAASWASLTRDVDCRRVTLRGLEHDAVAALLEPVLPDGGKRVPELERETAGNPFFLLEMARHVAESDTGGTSLPESVRDMIGSRLRRLSDDCAAILMVASLIGERFDAALLSAVAGLEETHAVMLLEEAARDGLVAEADGEPDSWRFSHALTRRVASAGLSRSRQARLQLRIAETLQARTGVPPAELAHHFGAAALGSGDAGAAAAAADYERLAGEHALREVAAEVAVRHFTRAIELTDRFRPGEEVLRCELLLSLADAHDRAGEYASRDERYAEAAEAATRLEDGMLLCRAALGYGGILPATVDPDPLAQALLEEALEQEDTDDGTRARVLARLAHWLHTVCPYAERRELAGRAETIARGGPDRRTLATVLLHRCWALDGPDDVADELAIAGEIEAIGDELHDPELTLQALRIRLHAQFERGDHADAVATAAGLKRLAEQVRHPEFIRLAAMWDVTVASLEGRFDDAGKLTDELDQRLSQLGHPQAQIIPVAQTFTRRWLQGHAPEYLPVFETLSAADPANPVWTAVTAWSLAEAGEQDRTAALLRSVGPGSPARADKNYLWWALVVGLSDAAALTGNAEWCQALYELAAPYSGHNCTLGVATFLGSCDLWLGVLAGTAGRADAAAAHLEAALARHQEMGARPWTALTREALERIRAGAPLTARPGTA